MADKQPGFVYILTRLPVKLKAALRGKLQTAYNAYQRGFTRTVSPNESVYRPLGNVHGKTVQRLEIFVLLAKRISFQNIFHILTSFVFLN